jgi:hypothetical protein
MQTRLRPALAIIAFIIFCILLASCVSRPAGDGETPAPTATEEGPQPTETEPSRQATTIDSVSLFVPEYWYSAQIELERLQALIFVQQDPEVMAEFNDPDLALPLDYAAGALIITPLPEGSDPETMSDAFLSDIPNLTADDLDAMLLPLDQAGLIDYTVVEGVELLRAWADTLAGLPAVVMDGTASFTDDMPPELRIQVWLTWTDASFVAFYALAAAPAWADAEAPLIAALESISIQ